MKEKIRMLKLLWSALRCAWLQLQSGPRTSGRGTPVVSLWTTDLKASWKTKPWIWATAHPDGDMEIDKKTGQTVIPPQLTLVYVRIPRRPIIVQLAWERKAEEQFAKQKRLA